MKKSRLPTIIAMASISLLVFLIAFNSVNSTETSMTLKHAINPSDGRSQPGD